MAARFHPPHPPRRHHRPGAHALTLVPAGLAAVLPMPHPASPPTRLVLLTCPPCDLAGDPMPALDAEQAAGAHDDHHHSGTPTAELHTLHTPRSGHRTASADQMVSGPAGDAA